MKVYLNSISGVSDAILSMFMSKRSWTPKLNLEIIDTYNKVYDKTGRKEVFYDTTDDAKVNDWLTKLFKWGKIHPTMLRFIDFSATVEGLHRGAQDDFDSHARRLDNRIIRSSTRLATFGTEKSDFYKDKILTYDEVFSVLDMTMPDKIVCNDITYIRTENGYIEEQYVNNKDVKRGLYMLSIPSNFIFKCNFAEWAHIVRERDCNSHAAPELRDMVEDINAKLQNIFPQLDKDFWYNVKG